MKNKKPFNAKKIQLYYNITHLAINAFLFYEACVNGWLAGYSYRCQSVDFALTGVPLRVCLLNHDLKSFDDLIQQLQIARDCWIYYLSKFTDFFETFIFILLKRFDMVNFYHVAHHSIMPVCLFSLNFTNVGLKRTLNISDISLVGSEVLSRFKTSF